MRKMLTGVVIFPLAAGVLLLCFAGHGIGDESAGTDTLERLVEAHPDSAILHAKLALLDFGKGTVRGRASAVRHMKLAIRLEPENAEYRLILAEMYFRRAQWSYGTVELRHLLKIDRDNDLGRCRLGKAYLERAIEEWSLDWFGRAAAELREVKGTSPVYLDACKHLALCYHDTGKPDSAVMLLQSVPEDSMDSECLLILGMSLCEMDDINESYGAFCSAMGGMDEGLRRTYTSLEAVASPEDLTLMAAASPGDLAELMEDMWKRRDPNPGTKVNERLVEHLSRVAFADLHFSVPRLGKRGSGTARGEVYIRCGRPLAWYFDPFGAEGLANLPIDGPRRPGPRDDLGGIPVNMADKADRVIAGIRAEHRNSPMYHTRRTWSWQYEGFVVSFEDRFMNGDFTFPYEGGWGSFAPGYYTEEVPEVYEMQIKKHMNVVLDALMLLAPGGKPYVKVVYACDTRGLKHGPVLGWPRGDFEVEVALLDSAYEELSRHASDMELAADSAALYQTHYPLIGTWRALAPPGEALAAVSIKSKANGAIGFTRKPVDIPVVGDSLWASDIEVRFGEEGPPNPTHVYLKKGEAYLGFSICNISPDADGMGEVDIGYMLTRQEKSSGLLERLAGFITGGSEADLSGELTSVWSMYRTRTVGRMTDEVIGIDLSPLSVGDYVVTVRAVDELSGQVAVTSTWLRIESNLAILR